MESAPPTPFAARAAGKYPLLPCKPTVWGRSLLVASGLLVACILGRGEALAAESEIGPLEEPAAIDAPAVRGVGDFWYFAQSEDTKDALLPLAFEFTVLHYDPAWDNLWVQIDGDSGYFQTDGKPLPIRSGQRVRASGEIIPSHGLSPDRVTFEIIDQAPLPPIDLTTSDFSEGDAINLKIATVAGFVDRQLTLDPDHLQFDIIHAGHRIEAIVTIERNAPIPQLVGSFAEATGIVVVTPGQANQPDGISMRVADIQTVRSAHSPEANALAGKPSRIVDLKTAPAEQFIKIQGTALAQEAGKWIIVRDATGQVQVATQQNRPIPAGTTVEVVGLPDADGINWTLRHALYRERPDSDRLAAETEGAVLFQLHLIEQALRLEPEAADRANPIDVTGVVTFIAPSRRAFFVQDNTGGIEVNAAGSELPPMDVGDAVTVKGKTTMGPYAPQINASALTVAGKINLPTPVKLNYDQAMSGAMTGVLVEMSGILDSTTRNDEWITFLLSTPSGDVPVRAPASSVFDELETGSVITARGVLSVEANEEGQLRGILLLSPHPNRLTVDMPALADPFALPISEIAELSKYKFHQNDYQRVRIQGVVTYHDSGRSLFIDDGRDSIRALSRSQQLLEPGDRVEAVGLPLRNGSHLVLRNAVYRLTGTAEQPAPVLLESAANIPSSLHGRLVAIEGKLIEISRIRQDLTLLVQTSDAILEARSRWGSMATIADALEPGARIVITGVCSQEGGAIDHDPQTRILLRSSEDVEILKAAPWWNARRALIVAIICQLAFLGGVAWVVLLRRRVNSQTRLIKKQIEREAMLEAQHREIVHGTTDLICAVSLDGRFTSFNKAGEALTGYRSGEAAAMTIYELLADAPAIAKVRAALETEGPRRSFSIEARLRTKSGQLRWVAGNWGFIERDGIATSAFGIIHDITDRKTIEEELKRARDAAEENTRNKSAFLATISHELRTPMNGVIGMTDLLLSAELGQEPRSYAETIRDSAASLLSLLNDILDFSKAEAGKLSIDPQPFEMAELVKQVATLLDTTAQAKGLQFTCSVSPSVPARVLGDSSRLRQVLINLIGNALKFTEKGSVCLQVRSEEATDDDDALRFEISDTGIGIPAKVQERLFQPFVQADGSHSRRFGGTGLGLAISKQIVELMGGQIGLSSAQGVGSTFWFTLRFPKAAGSSDDEAKPAEREVKNWSASNLRVLVAEDMPVNQRVTLLQLKKIGIKADLAENGVEVLERIQKESYDIIFMDCQMPVMDGFEATERLRADPRCDGVYVVALTANAMKADRERCFECGMNDYVSKPTNQRNLSDAIERFAQSRVS